MGKDREGVSDNGLALELISKVGYVYPGVVKLFPRDVNHYKDVINDLLKDGAIELIDEDSVMLTDSGKTVYDFLVQKFDLDYHVLITMANRRGWRR